MIPFLNWFFGDVMLPFSTVFAVALIATWPRSLWTPITGWLFMRRARVDRQRTLRDVMTPDRRDPQAPSGERAGVERTGSAPPVPNSAPSSAKAWSNQTSVGAVDPRSAASTGLHRHG